MSIEWKTLDDSAAVTIPARPVNGLWTLVRTQVSAPAILRIEATGNWRPVPGLPDCGPDGLWHWAFGRDMLLTRKAPLGALIGKLGGSNSSVEESEIFVVGSVAVLLIDKPVGPVYMTINDAAAFFDDNIGEMVVRIY